VSAAPYYTVHSLIVRRNVLHECGYCKRTYKTLAIAQQLHPICAMWSCNFHPSLRFTIYPNGTPRNPEAACCYCNDPLVQEEGKVNGALLKEHMAQHNFRACSQALFFSGQTFRQHLQDDHKTTQDSTLFAGWTLLLKASRQDKPAVFKPVETKAPGRRVNNESAGAKKEKKKKKDSKDKEQVAPTNFMEFTEVPTRIEPNKLRRKQSMPDEESRPSMQFFERSRVHNDGKPKTKPATSSKYGTPICPAFYRRRLDASTRNRLYMCEGDVMLAGDAQQVFRRVPGGVLGGLMLHSSLVASVPALMTNCVDVYELG
jgi:hypothetical protein